MSASLQHDRVVALAGACQCLAMIKEIARTGQVEQPLFDLMISSIIDTDPSHVTEIYGQTEALKLGFAVVNRQLNNKPNEKDNDLTRYMAGIMALERRLDKSANGFSELANRIDEIKRQQLHFALTDPQMIANLATIYSEVISPLGAKLQIVGMPQQLQKPAVQNKIRALLLATLRSIVLWRQVGGRRRHLIFQRRKLLHTTQHILATL